MARYLERSEDMARLINVNARLLMDLPKGTSLGWEPLIDITGSREAFLESHDSFDERVVLKYLITEKKSPISLLSNLEAAKENARTIRDVIPRECWEEINRLHLYAKENLNQGFSKRGRHAYLTEIIRSNQLITGLLAGTMNQDVGYLFLKLGRNLERADMTTRFIDVRTQNLFEIGEDLAPKAFDNIQWMNVLKSLTGYQMYRREMQVGIRHSQVLWFLFMSKVFPRSVLCCIDEIKRSIEKLPNQNKPYEAISQLKQTLSQTDFQTLDHKSLHKLIDDIQLLTADVHNALCNTYFLSSIATQETASQAQ
jgi:uncharacterized alpha-E superfamily protein